MAIRLLVDLNILLSDFHRRRLAQLIPKPIVIIPNIVLAELRHQARVAKQFILSHPRGDPQFFQYHRIYVIWKKTEELIQRKVWGSYGSIGSMSETLFSGIPNDLLIIRTAQELEHLTGEPVILATFDKQLLRLAQYESVRRIYIFRNAQGIMDFQLPVLREA